MLVSLPMPLPVRAIVVGLLLALLVIVTLPVRVPDVVGVNLTVTVQEAPTARVEQLLVWLKSPLAVTPETVAEVVPELVTVTVCAEDVLPTIVPAKVRLHGLGFRIGPGATPVPDSGTVLVMPDAVIDEVARTRAGRGRGELDADRAGRSRRRCELPQVLVWLKSPVVVIEPTGAAAVPLLVTVTACAALDEPVATEPKPTAFGLIEICEPLSGRYGGNVGLVMFGQAGGPEDRRSCRRRRSA